MNRLQTFFGGIAPLPRPEDLWGLEDRFRTALTSGAAEEALAELLQDLEVHPDRALPSFVANGEVLLCEREDLVLTLQLLGARTSEWLEPAPEHTLLGALTEPLALERLELPPFDPRTERPSGPLRRGGLLTLRRGEVVRLRGGRDLLRTTDARGGVALTLSTQPVVTSTWIFDPVTLAPIESSAASEQLAQLPLIADVLAALGDRRATEALSTLLTHPAPYVRWAAVTSLHDLDADRALGAAKHMAVHDPSEPLRDAAREAIEALSQGAR